ncbi:NDUFA12-domain-containing protein [Paraphysoderma sedebokerense]|nr:NDUFA12-domain-containing protein [Paraphysoderma sedebokerense]
MVSRLLRNFSRVGFREYLRQIMTIGDTKAGTLVGVDHLGNKYYESSEEVWARERWVLYATKDNDPSQVPAEWHMWLHRTSQEPPTKLDLPQHKWLGKPMENVTGTPRAYKPYSTTPPKIEAWQSKVGERTA